MNAAASEVAPDAAATSLVAVAAAGSSRLWDATDPVGLSAADDGCQGQPPGGTQAQLCAVLSQAVTVCYHQCCNSAGGDALGWGTMQRALAFHCAAAMAAVGRQCVGNRNVWQGGCSHCGDTGALETFLAHALHVTLHGEQASGLFSD
jgi:hypothetical protein